MKTKEPKYKFGKVMLLDDNELDNFINQKILESVHFAKNIYVNTSTQSAIEFIRNLTVAPELLSKSLPEVIFIDINMPIIDGFQFITLLKEIPSVNIDVVKLVILTSSLDERDEEKAKTISEDIVFLRKPLTGAMLAAL